MNIQDQATILRPDFILVFEAIFLFPAFYTIGKGGGDEYCFRSDCFMPDSSHVPRLCNFLKLITERPGQLVNLVHVTTTGTPDPQFLIRRKPIGRYFTDGKMVGT